MTLDKAIEILGDIRKKEIEFNFYDLWVRTLEDLIKRDPEISVKSILNEMRQFRNSLKEELNK